MLSMRQQIYKKNRLEGMYPELAAVAAGYSVSYARARAYRIEMSANVGIKKALAKAGLTDEYLAAMARQRIDANDGIVGFNYFKSVCQMKNHLVEKPLVDQSTHEHFTVVIKHPEKKNADTDNRSEEGIRANGEAGVGSRHITLA